MFCGSIHFLFFFFKQKTAYEMRISDWSSDVCSSDLLQPDIAAAAIDQGACLTQLGERAGNELLAAKTGIDRHQQHQIDLVEHEIGRASCRERVCQYV